VYGRHPSELGPQERRNLLEFVALAVLEAREREQAMDEARLGR